MLGEQGPSPPHALERQSATLAIGFQRRSTSAAHCMNDEPLGRGRWTVMAGHIAICSNLRGGDEADQTIVLLCCCAAVLLCCCAPGYPSVVAH